MSFDEQDPNLHPAVTCAIVAALVLVPWLLVWWAIR